MIWPWLIFVAVLGACVGSFLNVVIYRLPEGQSIVSPPSSCPKCGHGLAWYDNVPVLGWLWLRGRCRYCRNPISIQYPIIEAVTAALFGGWFYVCYMTDLRPGFAGPGVEATWLIFTVNAVLLAALLASTMIDARFYIIPLEIPWLATAAAVVLLPMAAGMHPEAVRTVEVPFEAAGVPFRLTDEARLNAVGEPYDGAAPVRIAVEWGRPGPVEVSAAPLVSGRAAMAAVGATGGLIVAVGLLWLGVLPRSFEDEGHDQPKDEDVPGGAAIEPAEPETGESAATAAYPDDPHEWLAHPHPRREVLKECLFLALPIIGAVAGYVIADADGNGSAVFRVLGGVLMGYLIGGATVWGMRVLGTLGFGKEAMGLGDVHLMAAVGAVCGWEVAVLAFFVAPFFGLTWAMVSAGAAKLLRRQVKMIPYGPHLAAATVLVMILREPMVAYFGVLGG